MCEQRSTCGRRRGGDMHVEDLLDDLPGARPGESAFGGDAEIADVFSRRLDAASRALRSVLGVNQPEIKLRAAAELQVLQGTVERVVGPRDRHRNVEIG